MIDTNENAPRSAHTVLFALLAVVSFLLYAAGVLLLRQDRAPGWSLEASGALPAAVSHLVYGTPLGAVDDNVLQKFYYRGKASAQDILAMAASKAIPPGPVDPTTFDGTGAGTNVFATIAMAMFGVKILSLVLLYLTMIGVAVVAFVLRYRDRRLIVLPLYFLVVTTMLLTPLGTSSWAIDQMPIGGQRYFVLAPFIPALHIFFEIVESSAAGTLKREVAYSILLLIQWLLFLGALLVRSSTGYLLIVLVAAWLWTLYRGKRPSVLRRALLRKTAVGAGALVVWVAIVVMALPAYIDSGRVLGNVWHRAFASFMLHPDWPFGDLSKVYDCTRYIPEGLSRHYEDRNGHCVWLAYPPNANRPLKDVSNELYGAAYEKVLRQAYFYVIFHYPRQAFELYVFVKSALIWAVVAADSRALLELSRAPAPKALLVVTATQLLLFVAFAVLVAVFEPPVIDRTMVIFPIFFIASLAPLYVGTPDEWTMTDMVFLMYSCLVLGVLLPVQLSLGAISRRARMPPVH